MTEIVLPHAMREETDSVYKARVNRYKHRAATLFDTAVFQAVYSTQVMNCVVGREVVEGGTVRRLTGAEKYIEGYFDVMLKAMLLKFAPDGHPNIVLSIAHPPDATPQLDALLKVVGGKHKAIRHDGVQVEWNVVAVVPFDEPAGGLMRALTSEYAAYNPYELDPGDKVMVVDIGGQISSMTPALLVSKQDVQTLWDDGATFELGIQDIKESLNDELRAIYPDTFKKRVAESIVEKAIRTFGHTEVQGHPMDVRDAVNLATAGLLNQIERVYIEDMNRAQDVKHIFITGGGGGLLQQILSTDIFEHSCSLAENIHYIHFANMRGGIYAFLQWIEANRNTPALRKVMNKATAPLFLVLDLGNNLLKGGTVDV